MSARPRTPAGDMLRRLIGLSALMLGMIVLRWALAAVGRTAPWYLLHELVVLLIPMAFLLVEVWGRLSATERVAFVATSGLFISLSAVAEMIAIQQRYWWFFTELDPLSGFDLGAIPTEEFLSYPLLLNLPVLWYLWLRRVAPQAPSGAAPPVLVRRALVAGAVVCGVLALALMVAGLANSGAIDRVTQPFVDPAGAVRYVAGPKQYGWTIVQLLGWVGLLLVAIRAWPAVHHGRLFLMTVTYFPFALFFELLACGRGWWAWNANQTLGVFTWVLPIESFSMYLTGALFPTLTFELLALALKGIEASGPAAEPAAR